MLGCEQAWAWCRVASGCASVRPGAKQFSSWTCIMHASLACTARSRRGVHVRLLWDLIFCVLVRGPSSDARVAYGSLE